MVIAGVANFAGLSVFRRTAAPPTRASLRRPVQRSAVTAVDSPTTNLAVNGWSEKTAEAVKSPARNVLEEEDEGERMRLKDYFEQAKVLIQSNNGGSGPPRWFSPLECVSRIEDSPLLLYLPGIDGVGLGLILQHHKLGKIFDIWCLHIPVKDRTSFEGLVLLVEETVRTENRRNPDRPIYLVGESVGGCLALAVAARNPDIDLVLILSNPATCYKKSQLQSLLPLLEVIPSDISLVNLPFMLSLFAGGPLKMASSSVEKRLEPQHTVEQLFHDLGKLSSYFPVLADILPRDTLLWKLQMMKSACFFANSRIHAVKAQILILASGKDPLLPSLEEAERIRGALPKQQIRVLKDTGAMPRCEIRKFNDSGHFLFLEDGFDLVAIIKGTSFYRRGKTHNYVADYFPPTASEFEKLYESVRWIDVATGPVMLSTIEDGKIVRGLEGIPQEGPVVLVGYHSLMGLEIYPLVTSFFARRNILLRGIAHPMLFVKVQENELDLSTFDSFRMMGAVPVSASNFYQLLSTKSHVLLYPGGMREALHKKGEEYKLIWPERSEFVRMAAKFGAKIIPFGVVGEDDVFEFVADIEDQMKIPYLRERIEKGDSQFIRVRTEEGGEVANQVGYLPILLPKPPGRYYFLFGKPIDTSGMKQELKNREKAHEVYLHVKLEVERCISYLKEKREKDPYRSIVARTLYQATHGWTSEVPTFEL